MNNPSQNKMLPPFTYWTVAGLLLIACPAHLFGEEQVSRIGSPSSEALNDRTEWFGTYFQGRKCGWARVTRKKIIIEEKKYFIAEMEITEKITSLGKTYDDYMIEHQEFMADPPFSLVKAEFQRRVDNNLIQIELKPRGDDFLAEVDDDGVKRELIISNLDFCFLDHLTIEDWIRGDPAVGQQLNIINFSLQDLEKSIDTYRVVFSGEKKIQGKTQKVRETSWASSLRGELGRITFNPDGVALLIQQGEAFEMRLEPEKQAKKICSRADFFINGTVGIDQPLGASPAHIVGLVLDVSGEKATGLRSGPGISIKMDKYGKSCRLITGFHRTPKIEATPGEISKNLEETLDYPIHDSEVRVLAKQAAGCANNNRDKLLNILVFIERFLGEDASSQILTVKETLREKKGDCSERAALLVTLARANGIPAREVHGLMYTSDVFRSFAGHSWSEVVLDGVWIPVDPTFGQMCVDGTHIRFESGEKGLVRLLEMTDGLSFHLVDIELGEPPGIHDQEHEKAKQSEK